MQKLTTIYIVRHGLSEANVKGMVAGIHNSPLVKEGEEQAKEVSGKLKDVRFDVVFSSDLIRAKRTAEIITLERKLAVATSGLLRERDYGTLDGKKETKKVIELLKKLEDQPSREDWLKYRLNDEAETSEQIIGRFMTFLREVAVAYSGKTILVVSHGSIMRSLLVHMGYASYDQLVQGTIKNTGYFRLETDGVDFFIRETKGVTVKGKLSE